MKRFLRTALPALLLVTVAAPFAGEGIASAADTGAAVTTNSASAVAATTVTLNGYVSTGFSTDNISYCYSTSSGDVTTCTGGTSVPASTGSLDTFNSNTADPANVTGLIAGTT